RRPNGSSRSGVRPRLQGRFQRNGVEKQRIDISWRRPLTNEIASVLAYSLSLPPGSRKSESSTPARAPAHAPFRCITQLALGKATGARLGSRVARPTAIIHQACITRGPASPYFAGGIVTHVPPEPRLAPGHRRRRPSGHCRLV